jgi:GGDEF domain-containing protein
MLMRLKGYIKGHPLVMESNKIPFSISYGIASTEDETILDPSALLKKADEALYWMKNALSEFDQKRPDRFSATLQFH